MAVGFSFALSGEADGDAAESGEWQIQCHAHTAHTPVQHHALAMKVDDAQMLVGGRVSDCETHGQGERVEPRCAARPGSEPAGFHLTPRKLKLPAGCGRPVVARMPDRGRNRLNNAG